MSELGSISVKINGDASGLISAASTAQNALNSLKGIANGLKSCNASITLKATDNASSVIEAAKRKADSFGSLKSEAKLSATDNTASGVSSARAALNSIHDKTVTITVRVKQEGSIPKFAKGTVSAPSGLARINDEKGVVDPRELIYHDGNYYLFEGKNILLPLDRGDRVYTASQTKNIMRMNGIKSYSSGKNNEIFEENKKIFKNRIKSSNVPVSEQLEWWKAAIEEYAYDSEAVMECSEEIFSLTKKLVKEMNGVSEAYVSQRSKLNDWESFGDNALEAFGRIKNNQNEYLSNGIITWSEYCDTLSDIGAEMYNQRIKHSENWLEQQLKYNNMSTEAYIDGLERMAKYTEEYYNNGLIGEVDYFYGMQNISNKKADMQAQKYKAEQETAREAYNSVLSYAEDCLKDVKNALKSEVSRLNYRIKKQELSEEYSEAYKAKDIYKNAVTQKGKEAYEAAEKKLIDISREQRKLALEENQTKILAEFESGYKAIELNKSVIIRNIMNGTINTDSILRNAQESFLIGQGNICNLLSELLNVARRNTGGTVYGGTTYNISGADSSIIRPLAERLKMSVRG